MNNHNFTYARARATLLAGVVLAGLVVPVSCCRDRHRGSSVAFKVIATDASFHGGTRSAWGPATRTAYSGTDENGSAVSASSALERIDWCDGDWIGIYCAQAERISGDNLLATYKVESHETVSNTVSRAQIKPVGDLNGLQWGTGTHVFQATYPATNAPVFSSAEKSRSGLNDQIFNGFIPATQTLTRKGDTDCYLPPMQYAWMFAQTETEPSSSVNLAFEPMFTAFEFSIGTGENERVDISSFSVSTTADDKAASGDFAIPVDDPWNESSYSFSNTGKSVNVSFANLEGGRLTVLKDHPVSITVLLLPQELSHLRITFTGDQIGTRHLALNDGSGNVLHFQGRRKYRIYGISFPRLMGADGEDVAWDHNADGEDVSWDHNGDGEDVSWDHNGEGQGIDWDHTTGGQGIGWEGGAGGQGVGWEGGAGGQGVGWEGGAGGQGVGWEGGAGGQGIGWEGGAGGQGVGWEGGAGGQGLGWEGGAGGQGIGWEGGVTGTGIIWSEGANGTQIFWGGTTEGSNVNWGEGSDGDNVNWNGITNGQNINWNGPEE